MTITNCKSHVPTPDDASRAVRDQIFDNRSQKPFGKQVPIGCNLDDPTWMEAKRLCEDFDAPGYVERFHGNLSIASAFIKFLPDCLVDAATISFIEAFGHVTFGKSQQAPCVTSGQ
jgi:hypothetical protein